MNGKCTVDYTPEKLFRFQPAFRCKTCESGKNELLCAYCARECHMTHDLEFVGNTLFFCDCERIHPNHCHGYHEDHVPIPPSFVCSYRGVAEYDEQHYFRCRDCDSSPNQSICLNCIRCCHRGHNISYYGYGGCYCDCPSFEGHPCKLDKVERTEDIKLERQAPTNPPHYCTIKDTGRDYKEQRAYTCKTCGCVRGQTICEHCAMVCHHGHDISYIGHSTCFCDCGAGDLNCQCKLPS